jgi:hypothetical protein
MLAGTHGSAASAHQDVRHSSRIAHADPTPIGACRPDPRSEFVPMDGPSGPKDLARCAGLVDLRERPKVAGMIVGCVSTIGQEALDEVQHLGLVVPAPGHTNLDPGTRELIPDPSHAVYLGRGERALILHRVERSCADSQWVYTDLQASIR